MLSEMVKGKSYQIGVLVSNPERGTSLHSISSKFGHMKCYSFGDMILGSVPY